MKKFLLFIIILFPVLSLAEIRYVKYDAGGLNNGTSWTDAYTSLQSALSSAVSGDQIWVAKGTYKPTTTTDRTISFAMKNGVAIFGGFSGIETNVTQRLNFGMGQVNETILSGDIGTSNDISDNSYHVFYHPSTISLNSTAILDGFTITGGNANATADHRLGGGMFNYSSSPTIRNVSFNSNDAVGGGGMYNFSCSPDLTNVIFIYNYASSVGGGIHTQWSTSTLNNVVITKNIANLGGGIVSFGEITLNNCILWGNISVSGEGKQAYLNGGYLNFNYSCYSDMAFDYDLFGSTLTADPNCITTDPKFVDESTGDFRLCGISPCINKGNNGYNASSTDIRGQARIQNTTIDMGAYEWTEGIDTYAIILYVDASKTDDSGNGWNWANAKKTLQAALNLANSNDQIWVAKGTCYPTVEVGGTGERFRSFQMKEGVSIYGGFAGTETNMNQRVNFGIGQTNETILSGDLSNNDDFDAANGGYQGTTGDDNCYHVFYHKDITLTTAGILDGFTISGGNANQGDWAHNWGGGMYNWAASPAISNVTFLNNSALSGGGGYFNLYSSPVMTNVSFLKNYAPCGGGMYNHGSSPIITNALFASNSASYGGGLFNTDLTNITLTNTTFSSNLALTGGGVYSSNSALVINNGIVYENNAVNNGNQFYLEAGATTTLNYSCYSNKENDVLASGATFNTTNNNITSHPKFVSIDSMDFRIAGSSPCINTGDNSYNTASTDIRGQLRIQNTTIDRGAYEWSAGIDPAGILIYVDSSKPDDTGDGLSWYAAKKTLQAALSLALGGDTVWVAKGTYYPTVDVGGTGERFRSFQMKEGVGIYGGFAGTETEINQRTNFGVGQTNETILSGDLSNNDDFDAANGGYQGTTGDDNCYHVFYHKDITLTTASILDGFTIIGGNANQGDWAHNWGGGIYNYSASPTISNVTIINNSAISGGGGYFNLYCSPVMTNVSFLKNYAPGGGGMYNHGSSPIITNALFASNSASYGGGLFNTDLTNITLTNTTFSSNLALTGGGVYSSNSALVINNGIVYENNAVNNGNQFYLEAGATTTLNYSCYSNKENDVLASGATFNTTNNNITSHPKFVSIDSMDFRIAGSSPCINTGDNSYNTASTDIRGQVRIQNTTIDMGAYEWTAGLDPVIENDLFVGTQNISSDETICFNAYNTITVAGGGTLVTIESGATVEFIAGKSIRFLPGFHAESGSIVNAHITTDSTFCDGAGGSPIVAQPVIKSLEEQPATDNRPTVQENKSVKLFPNPNNGRFTISLTNIGSESTVAVYNMLGVRVYSASVNEQTDLNIDLPDLRKGIYFVRVIDRKEQFTKKMIVN